MAFELGRAVSALMSQSSSVSSADERIDNFHKFILDNVPYGVVTPDNLQQGLIQFDGPAQDPPTAKKPLQWYFGAVPYAIIKAIRVQYTYTKAYQGTDYDVAGSLFIGYEDILETFIRTAQGLADRIEEITQPEERAKAERVRPMLPRAIAFRDTLESARKNRSEILTKPVTTLADIVKAIREEEPNLPGTVGALAQKADDLDKFMNDNYPYRSFLSLDWDLIFERDQNGQPRPIRIEKDGPAQRYDSLSPFPFTLATLFNDQDKYNQLLWWYFGARPYRITKAMRLAFGDAKSGLAQSLLLGFQGPGSVP
jgi:hypothetical protein